MQKKFWLYVISGCVILSALIFKVNTRYRVGIDGIQYISYTKNFVDGHGIAFSTTTLNDLANTIFVPMQGYPPGYCLLLGAAGRLGMDLLYANALLDSIGLVLFYFASLRILVYLQLSRRMQWIFGLLSIFFLPPFFYGNSSDLWSAVFFQAGIALSLYILHYQKFSWMNFAFLGLLLYGAAFVRYAYYPLVFVIPLTLGWMGFRDKNRSLWQGSSLSILLLLSGILCLSIYQKMYTGSIVYLNQSFAIPDAQWLYLQNLLKFDPFVLKAFFDPDQLMSDSENKFFIMLVHGLSLLISALMMVYIFYRIFFVQKSHHLTDHPIRQVYYIMGVLSSVVIMGLLTVLSLKDPPQIWKRWTYVQETRYYTPAMVFFLIFALVLLENQTLHRVVSRIIVVLFVLSFLFTTGMWISQNHKGLKRRDEKIEIYHTVKQWVQNSPMKVVYAEPGISNMYFVSIAGASPLMTLVDSEKLIMENEYEKLLQQSSLPASEPVLLLVRVYPSESEVEKFLHRFSAEKVLELPSSDLYAIYIKPERD